MMMARASADITSRARESWLARRNVDLGNQPPVVQLKRDKKPGSKVLVNGEWLLAEDEAARKMAPSSRSGGVGPRDGAL